MNTSLDDLNMHLFETIERLKSNNDPGASACEKIDLDVARQITCTGKVIVDIAKTKVQAMQILAKAANPNAISEALVKNGIVNQSQQMIEK